MVAPTVLTEVSPSEIAIALAQLSLETETWQLIVSGRNRGVAIARLGRALGELVVTGVETSAAFYRRVMEEPDFRAGALSIRYLEEHPELTEVADREEDIVAAAIAAALLEDDSRRHRAPRIGAGSPREMSPWRRSGWPWQVD